MTIPELVPLSVVLPSWDARRIAAHCRAGKIPGARKVGQEWMILRTDLDAWLASLAAKPEPSAPSVDDAIAVLRKRGLVP